MGGVPNTSGRGSKSNTTALNGRMPRWTDMGSDQYKNLNKYLTTAPMAGLAGMFQSGGMTPAMMQAQQMLGKHTPGWATLKDTAQGKYLTANPYIEDMVGKQTADVANQTGNMFAAGGRYGSTANQQAISQNVGEVANNLRNANYQSERDRMVGAGGTMENLRMGQASALGQLGQAGANNIFSSINALPTVQNNKLFDLNQQAQVGQQIDARTQQLLMNRIGKLKGLDMQGWQALGGLLSAATQSAGNWGTSTSQGTSSSSGGMNPLGAVGSLFGGKGGK